MAPPRKKRTLKAGDTHYYKIRLPEDLAQRIAATAKAEGRPQSRVIINELSKYPTLAKNSALGERLRDLEVILASYGGRITWLELSETLLAAVDAVLAADGAAVAGAIDKLRVARAGMLANQRAERKLK